MSYTLDSIINAFFGFVVPSQKIFVLYLLTSLLIAWVVWLKANHEQRDFKNFLRYVFDPRIYKHKSARQDYALFTVNGLIFLVLTGSLFLSEPHMARATTQALQAWFGTPSHSLLNPIAAAVLLTFVMALLHDFAFYIAHYALHKIPALWSFHKVHHSAEVMTPLSVLRLHPVEMNFNSAVTIAFVGPGLGVFSYLTLQEMTDMRIFGINLVTFMFYMTGVHLRHSHIWLHYPAWLASIFSSPAMHHIHHSAAAEHFDKNFSFMFSFWDRMFGTLHMPAGKEDIAFGIKMGERNPYKSVWDMYLKPFKELLQRPKKTNLEESPRGDY